ncbi:hypothetical protein CIG75_14090 [Tumebacillus algifaecis]|uniref:Cytosolic protein n=1 Tax=Tumebacillus algifaecis TaxID=1214604 RepID=A0A223D2V3_9BACL|nr:DUF3055 domain-containing protein [Tumebacillus algifaecis]ASS75979.1 hypothetical protein CIG75_14090 [Tumebacillus algifaecis]
MYINMYDQQEETVTRFVGFVGNHRWDLAITQTQHFYGKCLVINIQSGRSAILNKEDLEEDKRHILAAQFGLTDEEETDELAEFLLGNLPQ